MATARMPRVVARRGHCHDIGCCSQRGRYRVSATRVATTVEARVAPTMRWSRRCANATAPPAVHGRELRSCACRSCRPRRRPRAGARRARRSSVCAGVLAARDLGARAVLPHGDEHVGIGGRGRLDGERRRRSTSPSPATRLLLRRGSDRAARRAIALRADHRRRAPATTSSGV